MQGSSLVNLADHNQTVVLDAIRRSPRGLSQVELVQRSNLAPQTVSKITRKLIESGLVRTAGVTAVGRGKPRTTLRLEPSGGYAVGIHLDPAVAAVVVVDLTGKVVGELRSPPLLSDDPARSVAAVAAGARRLLEESSVPAGRVLGAGIATPGPLDLHQGTLVIPPWLPGWHGFPVRDELRRLLGLTVLIEKDTIAAAAGDLWEGDSSADSTCVFVYLGTGTGSAVSSGGVIARGASGNAGEIGHLCVDPGGPRCPCGRRGCLGRLSDPDALVRDAIAGGVLEEPGTELSPHVVDRLMSDLVRRAERSTSAAAMVERAASAIAEAVRVLVGVHNADQVILTGPYWSRLRPTLEPLVEQAIAQAPGPRSNRVAIRSAAGGDHVAATGAAALVFDQAFSPRVAT